MKNPAELSFGSSKAPAFLLASMLFSGCSLVTARPTTPPAPVDINAVHDAIPVQETKSRRGNETYKNDTVTYRILETSAGYDEEGIASWYGPGFHGNTTSSGVVYDMYKMTAAHTILPLPTYVEVTNLRNNRRIVVKVIDRGPFVDERLIDLSYVAALKLGMIESGTAPVRVRALDPPARDPALGLIPSTQRPQTRRQSMPAAVQTIEGRDQGSVWSGPPAPTRPRGCLCSSHPITPGSRTCP